MEILPLKLFETRSRFGTFERLKLMNVGFVKQKLFDSVHPSETKMPGQSQTICLDLRLCPCMFVSLGWTESKSFCFTNPEFIHFSLSKVPKSGPYFKKVKKAHVHLIRLGECDDFFHELRFCFRNRQN